jgi:hypothetical protein
VPQELVLRSFVLGFSRRRSMFAGTLYSFPASWISRSRAGDRARLQFLAVTVFPTGCSCFSPPLVHCQVGVLADLIFFLSLASSVLSLEPFLARTSRAPPESSLGIFRVRSSLPASWFKLANGSTPPKLLVFAGFQSRQVPRSDFVLAPFLPPVSSVFVSVSWSALLHLCYRQLCLLFQPGAQDFGPVIV